jgi:sensor histidine kinase YesM
VTISVRTDLNFTILSVEDDGPGMPEWASTILSSENEGKGGVGLRNIHLRLLKLYGSGIEIGMGSTGGTKVTLRIPQAARESMEVNR